MSSEDGHRDFVGESGVAADDTGGEDVGHSEGSTKVNEDVGFGNADISTLVGFAPDDASAASVHSSTFLPQQTDRKRYSGKAAMRANTRKSEAIAKTLVSAPPRASNRFRTERGEINARNTKNFKRTGKSLVISPRTQRNVQEVKSSRPTHGDFYTVSRSPIWIRGLSTIENAQQEERRAEVAMMERSAVEMTEFLHHARTRAQWIRMRHALNVMKRLISPLVKTRVLLKRSTSSGNTARDFTCAERQQAGKCVSVADVGGFALVSAQTWSRKAATSFPRGLVKPLYDLALRQEAIADVDFCASTAVCLTDRGMVYCFGCNSEQECGVPSKTHPVIASPGLPLTFQGLHVRITKVAAGLAHVLALTEDGTVFSWGKNSRGECGLGDRDVVMEPTKVHFRVVRTSLPPKHHVPLLPRETSVTSISCGKRCSVAVTQRGLWMWGSERTVAFPQVRIKEDGGSVMIWGDASRSSTQRMNSFQPPSRQREPTAQLLSPTSASSQLGRALKSWNMSVTGNLHFPTEVVQVAFRSLSGPKVAIVDKCVGGEFNCEQVAVCAHKSWMMDVYRLPRLKEKVYPMDTGVAYINNGHIYASGQVTGVKNAALESSGMAYRIPQLRMKTPIASLAVSSRHCLALTETRKVMCWGTMEFFCHTANAYRDQTVSRLIPAMNPLFRHATVSSIQCSMFDCAVRLADSRVFAWHFLDWLGTHFCPAVFQYTLAPSADRFCYVGDSINAVFAQTKKRQDRKSAHSSPNMRRSLLMSKASHVRSGSLNTVGAGPAWY